MSRMRSRKHFWDRLGWSWKNLMAEKHNMTKPFEYVSLPLLRIKTSSSDTFHNVCVKSYWYKLERNYTKVRNFALQDLFNLPTTDTSHSQTIPDITASLTRPKHKQAQKALFAGCPQKLLANKKPESIINVMCIRTPWFYLKYLPFSCPSKMTKILAMLNT